MFEPEEITYMDVFLNKLFQLQHQRIPFLEHDDASRALMGANMQRQAVPLKPEFTNRWYRY